MNLPSFTKNGVSDCFYNSFQPQLSGFRLWYQIYDLYKIISLFTWYQKVFIVVLYLVIDQSKKYLV